MILTITGYNKSRDIYEVHNDMNQSMVVNANQIIYALVNGNEFTNAYLTKKGFAIKYSGRTTYIQIANMPRQTELAILNRLEIIKKQEEAKKQAMTAAIRKPSLKNINVAQISGMRDPRQRSIVYKGTTYLSVESLCKDHHRDVETFRSLYNKGYSLDECLGLAKLRTESAVTPRAKAEKMLDAMAANRGE